MNLCRHPSANARVVGWQKSKQNDLTNTSERLSGRNPRYISTLKSNSPPSSVPATFLVWKKCSKTGGFPGGVRYDCWAPSTRYRDWACFILHSIRMADIRNRSWASCNAQLQCSVNFQPEEGIPLTVWYKINTFLKLKISINKEIEVIQSPNGFGKNIGLIRRFHSHKTCLTEIPWPFTHTIMLKAFKSLEAYDYFVFRKGGPISVKQKAVVVLKAEVAKQSQQDSHHLWVFAKRNGTILTATRKLSRSSLISVVV